MQRFTKTMFHLTWALALWSAGCKKAEVSVQLNVQAKNSQNEPVPEANVRINGKEIGTTDMHGSLEKEVKLEPNAVVKVEISKQSDKYYFAPYFDSFTVGSAKQQTVPVAATLYFVPKPSANEVALVEKQEAESQQPAVEGEVSAAKEPEAVEAPKPDAVPSVEPAPETAEATATKPENPELSLATVEQLKTAESNQEKPVKTGLMLFTVHVYSGAEPIEAAAVFLGDERSGNLKPGCTTNARGRCVLRFEDMPQEPVTIVAKKAGFETTSKQTTITHQGTLRLSLKSGNTIDIFAMSKVYNYVSGIEGIEVAIRGKTVGKTDKFGHLSYLYSGKASDLVDVSLHSENSIPEKYETDFLMAGPRSLVKYFSPQAPPNVRITLLKLQPAGSVSPTELTSFDSFVDEKLKRAVNKNIYATQAFQELGAVALNRLTKKANLSLPTLLRRGWAETPLKQHLDAVILPTLVLKDPPVLELSVVDSRGKVLAAAKENLENPRDAAAVDHAVAMIAKKISRSFPFEGAVTRVEGNNITVNLGSGFGRNVKAGDQFDLYGVQTGEFGGAQAHTKIGTLVVKDVSNAQSTCTLRHLAARAVVNRGDLVVLKQIGAEIVVVASDNNTEIDNLQQIHIASKELSGKTTPVTQANIYYNDRWLGASDDEGNLFLNPLKDKGAGNLKIIKHGYKDFSQEISLTKHEQLAITLQREATLLRVESKPSGATVSVDGKVIGHTPMAAPIAVPRGFIKLEVSGPEGFKPYSSVLDVDEGTLELTGVNQVELETDFRKVADKLLQAGNIEGALKKLREVPETHSDYLQAAHERGEIYMTKLHRPALAAKAFSRVTSDPRVKSFIDKRFIGTHLNEGIALFMTAESLAADQPEAAQAHYLKAAEILQTVSPQLRFIDKDHYQLAVHNVMYYQALCQQKLWSLTKNAAYLSAAEKSWKTYIDNYATGNHKDYIENAQIYLKQAQASLSGIDKNATAN